MNLFGPANPLTAERVRALVELAWWDGLRTGLVAGVLLGVFCGVALAALLREPRNGP